MIRIAVRDEPNLSGCTFYRSHYPISELARAGKIQAIRVEQWRPIDYLYADILFRPRPLNQAHLHEIIAAKKHGCKVWIDIDDDFHNIPELNPAGDAVNEHIETMEQCLKVADVISVSTEFLKGRVQKSTKVPIEVVPNILQIPKKINTNFTKPKVFWRGSSTHTGDLKSWKDVIVRAGNTFEFHWFGRPPYFADEFDRMYSFDLVATGKVKAEYPCVLRHKWTNIHEYFRKLRNIGLNVLLYPLQDNIFNRSKSNIAWQEATFAGAACITNAKGDEWERPGILRDPEILFKEDKKAIRDAVKRSRFEMAKFTFQDRQDQMMEIAEKLLKNEYR